MNQPPWPPPGAPGGPLPPPPGAPGGPAPPPPILGGLIPRNGQALVAYYCGLFALIPFLGDILGPVAVVCGILGLKAAKREPYRKGQVHAWVGIACGALFGLFNFAITALLIAELVAHPPR